ncbi:hypothetical protein C5C52_07960 [Rathayibacter sp. AY1E5]|uniref:hypothetical protein n=1 Tax=Rathayibacter sp. AY1E5 TaxID=2080553 RepID=UPI000CE93906|nr:hypothetical protein [Rathayibacter sp. AY1E5]PPG81745.1 hypothetical protein C5C52_07960 [Rathayibacter sp. AY1E5]
MEEDEVLRLVDFILATNSRNPGELNALLLAAGSTWKVGERAGRAGLEHRVPAGVADAADYIVSHSATAGALLAEAWHAVFGRVPDPEEAYEKAIKAVEEAGAAIVLPKNPKATLGTMLATMEPQGWRLPLDEAALHPSNDSATKMAWALWSGQPSRHGGNHYRKPTQEEAEAAVLLAVPLVQWFTSGVLARR